MASQHYDSLTDPHLNPYFHNKRIRHHLLKAGLINRQGEILPPATYEAAVAKKEKRKKDKQKLYHAIADYVLEEERKRQAFLNKQFDFAIKRIRVQNIRESRYNRSQSHFNSLTYFNKQQKIRDARTPSPAARKRSPIRTKSVGQLAINLQPQLRPCSPRKKHDNKNELCEVTMVYYGPPTPLDPKAAWSKPNGDEVMVMQQHCGGENLIVYKGFVIPNQTFKFQSRRHPDYPFAVSIYINGLIDSRLSVCCEYKHKLNTRLGSKHGLFALRSVKKSEPCRFCRLEKRLKQKTQTSPTISNQDLYRKSVVPRKEATSSSSSGTDTDEESNKEKSAAIPTETQSDPSARRHSSASSQSKTQSNQDISTDKRPTSDKEFRTPEPELLAKNKDDRKKSASILSSSSENSKLIPLVTTPKNEKYSPLGHHDPDDFFNIRPTAKKFDNKPDSNSKIMFRPEFSTDEDEDETLSMSSKKADEDIKPMPKASISLPTASDTKQQSSKQKSMKQNKLSELYDSSDSARSSQKGGKQEYLEIFEHPRSPNGSSTLNLPPPPQLLNQNIGKKKRSDSSSSSSIPALPSPYQPFNRNNEKKNRSDSSSSSSTMSLSRPSQPFNQNIENKNRSDSSSSSSTMSLSRPSQPLSQNTEKKKHSDSSTSSSISDSSRRRQTTQQNIEQNDHRDSPRNLTRPLSARQPGTKPEYSQPYNRPASSSGSSTLESSDEENTSQQDDNLNKPSDSPRNSLGSDFTRKLLEAQKVIEENTRFDTPSSIPNSNSPLKSDTKPEYPEPYKRPDSSDGSSTLDSSDDEDTKQQEVDQHKLFNLPKNPSSSNSSRQPSIKQGSTGKNNDENSPISSPTPKLFNSSPLFNNHTKSSDDSSILSSASLEQEITDGAKKSDSHRSSKSSTDKLVINNIPAEASHNESDSSSYDEQEEEAVPIPSPKWRTTEQQSSEPKNDDTSVREYLPMENIAVVWLDEVTDKTDDDTNNLKAQFRQIARILKTFSDPEKCIEWIEEITSEKVFLIVSGQLSESILKQVDDYDQIASAFIFCQQKFKYEYLMNQYEKVKGIYTDTQALIDHVKVESKQWDNDLSTFQTILLNDTNQLNPDELLFVHNQLFKKYLLENNYPQECLGDLVDYCTNLYSENNKELSLIKEFEQNYNKNNALNWYTKDSFAYHMLNRAIRMKDMSILFQMGFFIIDINQQLEKYYSETPSRSSLTVFRGQGLKAEYFEDLKRKRDGLMSFNGFLSTSTKYDVAYKFAQRSLSNGFPIAVVFEMEIDPTNNSCPYVSLENFSSYQSEYEILFSLEAIFHIKSVEQLKDNIWKVNLTLINEKENVIQNYIQIEDNQFNEFADFEKLGELLIKMNEFAKAKDVYEMNVPSNTDPKYLRVYSRLGFICEKLENYSQAALYYKLALNTKASHSLNDYVMISNINNQIGKLLYKEEKIDEALSKFKTALDIQLEHLSSQHPSLINTYDLLGKLYQDQGDYEVALEYYEKKLDIQDNSVDPNQTDLALTHYNIGICLENLDRISEAMNHVEKSIKMTRFDDSTLKDRKSALERLRTELE